MLLCIRQVRANVAAHYDKRAKLSGHYGLWIISKYAAHFPVPPAS
jgi:hypothetical protein